MLNKHFNNFIKFLVFISAIFSLNAQKAKTKLVVGIVVDQMRYDYLNRFEDHFGNNGFKRLINKGFSCNNNHYNYVPTYTVLDTLLFSPSATKISWNNCK